MLGRVGELLVDEKAMEMLFPSGREDRVDRREDPILCARDNTSRVFVILQGFFREVSQESVGVRYWIPGGARGRKENRVDCVAGSTDQPALASGSQGQMPYCP